MRVWFVGLDVHRAATTASVRNSRGIVIRREVVPTTRSGLRAVFKDLRGRVKVTCETGPLAIWVKHVLSTRLREVIVCDPRRNRLLLHGSKTDGVDADKLSELLRLNALNPVYTPSGDHAELRRLAFHYGRMVGDRTRILQRLRSLFLEMGVRIPPGRGGASRVSLRPLRDKAARSIAHAYLRQLEIAIELVEAARRDMLAQAARFAAFELLQSIPYIGEIRAAELIAVVGTPDRFARLRQFWAYGGLAVEHRVSAEHKIENGIPVREQRSRGFRLTKRGQPRLKKVLKDIAVHASIGTGEFRRVYDRHIRRGIAPPIARLALARKIAAVILAIWRSGKVFKTSILRGRKGR